MKFTESQLESAIIELLDKENLGLRVGNVFTLCKHKYLWYGSKYVAHLTKVSFL